VSRPRARLPGATSTTSLLERARHGGLRRAPRCAVAGRVELRRAPWRAAPSSAARHGGRCRPRRRQRQASSLNLRTYISSWRAAGLAAELHARGARGSIRRRRAACPPAREGRGERRGGEGERRRGAVGWRPRTMTGARGGGQGAERGDRRWGEGGDRRRGRRAVRRRRGTLGLGEREGAWEAEGGRAEGGAVGLGRTVGG